MGQVRPREIAIQILSASAEKSDFVEHRLHRNELFMRLPTRDRHLVQELAYGVIRNRPLLDRWIGQRTDGRDQKDLVMNVLRVGVYQLIHLDRIPDHAAVHETIAAARSLGIRGEIRFLNAILRRICREKASIRADLDFLRQSDPAQGWSMPGWLVARWQQRWPDWKSVDRQNGGDPANAGDNGPASASALNPAPFDAPADPATWLCAWSSTPAPLVARCNLLKSSPTALTDQWAREGVEAREIPCAWMEPGSFYALTLPTTGPVQSLPSFQAGAFYLQDPSTSLAPAWMDVRAGQRVLDLCAAPGGKTALLAQFMDNQGDLIAVDLDPARLQRLRENCSRLGVTCCRSLDLPAFLQETASDSAPFDRILVDAPCSNTGVLRRRVELRWRLTERELERLVAAQFQLLHRASTLLADDGLLVYSTCSIEPEENQGVVAAFLEAHPDFEQVRERTLLPFRDQIDGAYVSVLRKRLKRQGATVA